MDYCCITNTGLDYLINTVGIDIFRIACYSTQNGYTSNPSGFTAQVNSVVAMCEQKGIYALIDWHNLTDGDPNTNIIYARTFWESMATAHKDRRNVIYEICNEPNGVSWTQVRTYANDIIPRIRAIDPDAVIIVGTPNWSQLGSEVVSNKLSFSNIMYTFHFYAATHDTSMLTNFVGQLPIFVTEWAPTEASGAGGTNYTRADQFISIMATNKISWCAWSWSEAPETSGMLNPGSCDAGTWNSYKPTGSYVVGKINNPPDNFGACTIATVTNTPNVPAPTETVGPANMFLDNMTDGNYMSSICTDWYTYDDSNDCTDKDCVKNPKGTSLIVPWSRDRFEDTGQPIMPFYMQSPGRGGGTDYAAHISGVVTTTFLYGFAGLGFPLKEPQAPVNISTATGLSFWCKSAIPMSFRLKINSPAAFGGKEDEDMYGYVFSATTAWTKVTVDFASVLFSQEGWGDTTVTRTMALSAVNAIQWQTQGQTGAPYTYDLWVDDVVLINAPAAQKTIAAIGCMPPAMTSTNTPATTLTFTPSKTMTATRTATSTATSTATRTATGTATRTNTAMASYTNTPANTPTNTYTAMQTATWSATRTNTPYNSPTLTVTGTYTIIPTFTSTSSVQSSKTATQTRTATLSHTASPTITLTETGTPPTATHTPTITRTLTPPPTATQTPADTPTSTRTSTATATKTATAADTPTEFPTGMATFTYTATAVPTGTATEIPSETPANTPVNTPVDTPANTATAIPTQVNTAVWTATNTAVNTPAATASRTATYTHTIMPTATATPVNTITPTQTPAAADSETFKITGEIIYPNPYNPGFGTPLRLKAEFSQSHRNVVLRIYSSAMRLVRECKLPDSAWAGTRTMPLQATVFTGLANGCYFYVITAEGQNKETAKSGISGLIILK